MKVDEKLMNNMVKAAVADAKAKMADATKTRVVISLNDYTFVFGQNNHISMRVGDEQFKLPEMEKSEIAEFTAALSRAILAKLNVSKKWFINEVDYMIECGRWYAPEKYRGVKRIVLIKPCKEYLALQKKLTALKIPLNWSEWRHDGVFGKRLSYSVTDTTYAATKAKVCERALEFLKGCRSARVEIKRIENLEDRDYGERYETEWSGSIDYALEVTAKGKTEKFYAW